MFIGLLIGQRATFIQLKMARRKSWHEDFYISFFPVFLPAQYNPRTVKRRTTVFFFFFALTYQFWSLLRYGTD
jgi:hypothetical protein